HLVGMLSVTSRCLFSVKAFASSSEQDRVGSGPQGHMPNDPLVDFEQPRARSGSSFAASLSDLT
ncbi:MAG TPA: hypothetical protein VK602_07320, partial [Phyllobacterium sp.]|nr:hypothetical protein [Phyllobacterium sp.]